MSIAIDAGEVVSCEHCQTPLFQVTRRVEPGEWVGSQNVILADGSPVSAGDIINACSNCGRFSGVAGTPPDKVYALHINGNWRHFTTRA